MRNIIITTLFIAVFAAVAPYGQTYAASGDSTGILSDSSRTGEENNGSIKGRVITAEGQPAAFVTIQLKGFKQSTLTDEDGNFTLRNLAPGEYDLEVSLTGFASVTQHVTVEYRKTASIAIQLQVSGRQLQEVVVSGGRNRFARNSSDYVAKMPLKNIENPQVYTTITRDLMNQQLVFSLDDAMRNATGIQRMWAATGRSGDGGGYYNSRGFILQSMLRNGIAGNISTTIDAANIERVEVIKGPSATLFGSTLTSYGGLINRVTKKPYASFGGEMTYAGGSFGYNRISADVNTPLDSARNILLRVNTAYLDEGSFQDNGFNRLFSFAPSLSYKINDRLSLLFDAEIYRGTNLMPTIFFFPYGQTIARMGYDRADQLPIDYRRSFFSDDLSQKSANTNLFGQLQYKISDKWSTQTNVTVTNSYSDGPGPYFYLLSNDSVLHNPSAAGSDYISRNDQFTANSRDRMLEIQQNLNGEFYLGSVQNRLVTGLDYFNRNSSQFFSGNTFDTIASHGNIPTYRHFDRAALANMYQTKGVSFVYPVDVVTNTYSAYVSDVANLTDNLLVMAALRVDHFVNNGNYDVTTGKKAGAYNQTALSPKFGVVFQPVKDQVALFANYQSGFTNKTGTDFRNKAFRPENAYQAEAGVKLDLLGGKLTSTVSVYDIRVRNIIRAYVPAVPDPSLPPFPQIQDGEQHSRGIEAEVIANPIQGLNIVAGFSYNDSKYTKADPDVAGRRPGTASSPYVANWWISYRLPAGALKGLGFGFGGNYASDNKIINSKTVGVFTLPAYTVLNASIFYDYAKFRVAVKTDNLTDKKYWIGYSTMNPQKLRSVVASVSFKF